MTRILVIEPEAYFLSALMSVLELDNYDLVSARSAQEGLEHIRQQPPDLIVSNMILPDGTGPALVQQFRSLAAAPIILLTVHADPEKYKESMLGKVFFLRKTFDAEELLDRVKAVLEISLKGYDAEV
jgi:DNA-binding response OmpR family regulator